MAADTGEGWDCLAGSASEGAPSPGEGWEQLAGEDVQSSESPGQDEGAASEPDSEGHTVAEQWGALAEVAEAGCSSSETEPDPQTEAIVLAEVGQDQFAVALPMLPVEPEQALIEARASVSSGAGVDSHVLGRACAIIGGLAPSATYRGRAIFDDTTMTIAKHVAQTAHVRSVAVVATDTGADPRKVQRVRTRLGAASLHIARYEVLQMINDLSTVVLRGGGRLISISSRVRFDETPLRIRGKVKDNILEGLPRDMLVDQMALAASETVEAAPTKLVQFEWGVSILFCYNGSYHQVAFSAPVNIAVVDKATAEVYKELCRRNLPNMRNLEGRFGRVQRLLTTDGDAACAKAGRAQAVEERFVGHLRLTCDVHKTSHVAQRVDSLASLEVTGMVNLALSLQAPGAMRDFRKHLRKYLSSTVVRLAGSPSAAADRHRIAILDMYCPPIRGRPQKQLKRAIVAALANGDYRETGQVQHYCQGCCQNEAETKLKFVSVFTNLLAGRAPRVFPRSRWTGADECLRWLGLVASIHGLLGKVYPAWAAAMGTKLPKSAADPGQASFLQGGDMVVESEDADAFAAWGAVADTATAPGAATAPDEAAQAGDFREMLRGYRQRGLGFVVAPHRPKLVMLSVVLLPQQRLMSNYLSVSGLAWDEKEHNMAAFAKANDKERLPQWRALLSSTQALERDFLEQLGALLKGSAPQWQALEPGDFVAANRAFAFRLLNTAGAECYRALFHPHTLYPWKAFGLAAGVLEGDFAETLESEPPCLLDSWTAHFVKAYAGNLDSSDAKADCLATAFLVLGDTAQIERQHAAIRRRVTVASTQTHTQHVQAASSEFVFRQVGSGKLEAHAAELGAEAAHSSRKRKEQGDSDSDTQAPRAKAKRGGGGPFRAFVHREASGRKGRPDLAALGERYKRLPFQEKEELKIVGRAATLAHQRNNSRAFGPTSREAARSRAKRHRQEQVQLGRELGRNALLRSLDDPAGTSNLELSLYGQTAAFGATRLPQLTSSWDDFILNVQQAIRRSSDHGAALDFELSKCGQSQEMHVRDKEDSQALLTSAFGDQHASALRSVCVSTAGLCSWKWAPPGIIEKAARCISMRADGANPKDLQVALDTDWAHRHEMLCHDQCPALGRVPPVETTCSVEGICLCSGPGRSTRLMMEHLNSTLKEVLHTPESRSLLSQGVIGILLEGSADNEADARGKARSTKKALVAATQVFLHVAQHLLSPFRPTYMRMTLSALQGTVAHCSAQEGWLTQAQVLDSVDKGLLWRVRVYQLDQLCVPLAEFAPECQTYTEMPMGKGQGLFWRGADDEGKAAKKKWKDERRTDEQSNTAAGQPMAALEEELADEGGCSDDCDDGDASSLGLGASSSEGDPFLFSDGEDIICDESGGDDNLPPIAPAMSHSSGAGGADVGGARAAECGDEVGRAASSGPASSRDMTGTLLYSVPGGELRYYPKTRRFAAHCENPAHGNCRREKLAFAGASAAQGRPLGYLTAWLLDSDQATHAEHMCLTNVLPYSQRLDGRRALQEALGPNCPLFASERPRRSGESEEPELCP